MTKRTDAVTGAGNYSGTPKMTMEEHVRATVVLVGLIVSAVFLTKAYFLNRDTDATNAKLQEISERMQALADAKEGCLSRHSADACHRYNQILSR